MQWYIEYLTRVARIQEIVVDVSGFKIDCLRCQSIMKLPGAQAMVSGFGSSDFHCFSHLAHFGKSPD